LKLRLFLSRALSVVVGMLAAFLAWAWAPNAPTVTTTAEFSWLSVTQTVIAGCLLAAVIGMFKFSRIVGNWYHTNEERLRELEDARQRHRAELDWHDLRLNEVENHLGDLEPEFRHRIQEMIRSGKLPDRRVSDKR
jgi:hypothetical protein